MAGQVHEAGITQETPFSIYDYALLHFGRSRTQPRKKDARIDQCIKKRNF